MKYIVMCGGKYDGWETPRQLIEINGEPIIARTVRLLKEAGAEDIYISANDKRFAPYAPLLEHTNTFQGYVKSGGGTWVEAFYPMEEPACYLMGDVVFSPEAVMQIVNKDTDSIDFFASAPPFDNRYIKPWAEPFAFKVTDQTTFRNAINAVKELEEAGLFYRRPIAWELWQVIKETPLNVITENYTVINDYTCDIDKPEDVRKIEQIMRGIRNE